MRIFDVVSAVSLKTMLLRYIIYFLMKHAPSLESNTTYCKLVGNAVPAPIRMPSLHFLYIVFLRLYNVLSLALLLLQFIEIY